MRTPKQIAAPSTNGALSKDPVSPQGKLYSPQNSARHGLLARTVVLEAECTDRFLELLRALIEEFQPATATEVMLVETMAVARWRQLRIWGLQKVAMDREIALQDPDLGSPAVRAALAFNAKSDSAQPDLLLRYDIALDRQFSRSLARLMDLQSRPAPKTSTPYFPDSLASHTWRDTPPDPQTPSPQGREDCLQRRETDPGSESSTGSGSDLAVLQAQRNDPGSESSTGSGSDLAVLQAPIKDPVTKRTQQPVDSTQSEPEAA